MRIGVDIGGTHTRIASVEHGRPTHIARFATEADYARQVRRVVQAIRSAYPSPAAVGVSVGGRLTRDGGTVRVALNLRDYENRPIREDLTQALACPVRLAHDATCGLLGESAFGCLAGIDRCAYLTLSTGTGCAVRLGAGDTFVVMSTEAGHQLIAGNDRLCLCGQRGCLETFTGGRMASQGPVGRLEDQHDEDFWRRYADWLAHGLANIALICGVDAIALGGSIALRRTELWPMLSTSLDGILRYQSLSVRRAGLGEDAPLVGAVALLDVATTSVLH